jgi:hypothetical protein
MKHKLLMSLLLILLSSCNLPPIIMSVTGTVDGTNLNINFDTFQSAEGGVLTFSNGDGDTLIFKLAPLAPGSVNITGTNTMTGTFNVLSAEGAMTQLQFEDTDVGFININSVSGTPPNVTNMTASFQVNVKPAGVPSSTLNQGSIIGTINF